MTYGINLITMRGEYSETEKKEIQGKIIKLPNQFYQMGHYLMVGRIEFAIVKIQYDFNTERCEVFVAQQTSRNNFATINGAN